MSKKVCNTCKIEKPLSEFEPRHDSKDGRRGECRDCHNEKKRIRYSKNPEKYNAVNRAHYAKHPEKSRNRHLKNTYGISLKQYNNMLIKQDHKCLICKKHVSENLYKGNQVNFAVDHCHKSNKVRGLLCQLCNVGLGSFKDSKELLLAAIEYIDNN